MIHKLLLYRQPFGTVVSLRTCLWSFNTGRSMRLNQKSFSSGANITNKQQMNLVLQPWNQALLSISNCKRNMSNDKSFSVPSYLPRPRYSHRFLEFHESIKCRKDDFTMSHSEWENLESEILTEVPSLAVGLDYSIMKSLSAMPDLSVSFFNYIKSKREPNKYVLIEFFLNCAEKYEDIVLDEFEKFMKTNDKHKLIYTSGNRIAQSISKTREWRQSIPLLDLKVKNEGQIALGALTACTQILKAALKEQDYKVFFEVWTSFLPLKYRCDTELFSQAFYESWEEGVIPVDVLFELLKLEELPLQDYQMRELQEYCSRKWTTSAVAKVTNVDRQRRCSTCSEKIPEYEAIDASVFEKLCEQTLHKLLIGENIYRNSNPQELKRFYDFMSKQKQPFDYVIDGSNVIYMRRTPTTEYLEFMVKNLNSDGKRVLVIIKGNQRKLLQSLQKWATAISVDYKSYDDCYIMLAAFLSGRKCFVVTNDDLKDHVALLDGTVKPYFHLWREQQRIFHFEEKLLHPPTYRWKAHESEKAWHIPYEKTDKSKQQNIGNLFSKFNLRSFICVRKLNYVPSPELTLFKKSKNELLRK
ncbi:mitochondrial ribonuclease P catalytic subunit-like isoform X2 [Mercenaria mercenaria]|uniref:mitochondrial ribonuclease P catalytic subunit-like isoform X2 n=1 Tax=Mercenaria mercenaria TaxID=6596 RepID=UPI00234EAA50|nr:mitochondrial ribonuclease P catalytic subunit-like isoform X2 [Mercenaria mercenaria]